MHSTTADIFGRKVFTTKKRPFYFYLILSLWILLLILFLAILKLKDFDKDSIVSVSIVLFCFAIYFYILFGRYLTRIIFYEHKIQVNYLFPWNKQIEFKFDKLKEIEFKEFDFLDRLTRSWYRGGKWLYLKAESGKVCQFKYTIDDSENKKLLTELQKRCNTDIAYC